MPSILRLGAGSCQPRNGINFRRAVAVGSDLLLDVVGFATVLTGALALALDPGRRRVGLLGSRRGLRFGGLRLACEALGLGRPVGSLLPPRLLLVGEVIGFRGVGLRLVPVGARSFGEPFPLDALLLTTPAQRPDGDGGDDEDHDDDHDDQHD